MAVLPATVFLVARCGNPKAAPAIPSREVEVATVLQKDVPISSEWVATLDGCINAQIQPLVAGYVIRQRTKPGVPQDAAPGEMKVATKYEWASVAPFGSGAWQS
jgi:hypothetical protein